MQGVYTSRTLDLELLRRRGVEIEEVDNKHVVLGFPVHPCKVLADEGAARLREMDLTDVEIDRIHDVMHVHFDDEIVKIMMTSALR